MKRAPQMLLLLTSLGAIVAHAQTYNTPIQHVIVIIQENRTPDNLFGAQTNGKFLEPGVNLVVNGNSYGTSVPLAKVPLTTCYNPSHGNKDWQAMYDGGKMDGANGEKIQNPLGSQCQVPPTNVPFAYVENDSGNNYAVNPYFMIAQQFGFANYMFQTNQGPSFPAHQFLFTGTSAPVSYPNTYYDWFVSEEPPSIGKNAGATGCVAQPTTSVLEMDDTVPYTEKAGYAPPGAIAGFPCYSHNTVASVLDPASVTWKYYAQTQTELWSAPVAIDALCVPSLSEGGGTCTGAEFNSNVVTPSAGILTDIRDCALPGVSFVVPDGAWSDHGGQGDKGYGPSWVAAIVNSIGQGMSGSKCNPLGSPVYWNNTVVLVTWDDWGGWYDHVAPPNLGFSNGTGQQYVYGFRVPLLVVSAYSVSKAYVSGAWTTGPQPMACPFSTTPQYCHDFGSILNFIEYVFGSGGKPLSDISPTYHYADYLAPDAPFNCGVSCPYSLSDFFNFSRQPNKFVSISAPYDAKFFLNYTGGPVDPDDDADEE